MLIGDRRQGREGSPQSVCILPVTTVGNWGTHWGTLGASVEAMPQSYLKQGDRKLGYLTTNSYLSLVGGCLETLILQHFHFSMHRVLNAPVVSKNTLRRRVTDIHK